MPEEKKEKEEQKPWFYEHPKDHPDNKPPVTVVAQASDEEAKRYSDSINAGLAKTQPKEAPPSQQEQTAPPKDGAKAEGSSETSASPEEEQVNYEEKTVPELKEIAFERGLEIPYDARKDEIIKALEKQDKKEKGK